MADLLGVVLTEIGCRCEDGRCRVGQEHEASHRLQGALSTCSATLPTPPSAPRCLFAAVDGESHTLALNLTELCLREAGWGSVWLGSPTSTSVLVEAIQRLAPTVVGVSASAWSSDAEALAQHYRLIARACRRSGAALVLVLVLVFVLVLVLVLGGEGAWPRMPGYGERVRSFKEFAPLLSQAQALRYAADHAADYGAVNGPLAAARHKASDQRAFKGAVQRVCGGFGWWCRCPRHAACRPSTGRDSARRLRPPKRRCLWPCHP